MWCLEYGRVRGGSLLSDGIVTLQVSIDEMFAIWTMCGRLLDKLPADGLVFDSANKQQEHAYIPSDIVTIDPDNANVFIIRLPTQDSRTNSTQRFVEYRIDRESADDLWAMKYSLIEQKEEYET